MKAYLKPYLEQFNKLPSLNRLFLTVMVGFILIIMISCTSAVVSDIVSGSAKGAREQRAANGPEYSARDVEGGWLDTHSNAPSVLTLDRYGGFILGFMASGGQHEGTWTISDNVITLSPRNAAKSKLRIKDENTLVETQYGVVYVRSQ